MKQVAKNEFNYCKWAKLLVAIPALPLIAILATIPFSNPITQGVAAVAAVCLTLAAAVWLDRVPALQAKFRNETLNSK